MSKINKFNEFLNNEELIIKQMIEEGERTNLGDLEAIAERKDYKEVVLLGEKVIPYLLERLDITGPIWDRALNELTNEGLNPLEYDTTERVKYWKKWAKNNGY